MIFVLKHVYYYQWKELIEKENPFLEECLNGAKLSCVTLHATKWADQEKKELFLS